MKIEVRLTDTSLRRWHLELIERLSSIPDTQVGVTMLAGPDFRRGADPIERIFALERVLHRTPGGLGERIDQVVVAGWTVELDEDPDIRLDLSAEPDHGVEDDRTWRLLFDGRPGEAAAIEALRRGQPPLVSLVNGPGTVLGTARPGSETPGVLSAAFADLLAGTTTLIVETVRGLPPSDPAPLPAPEAGGPRSLGRHAFGQLAGSIAHRGYRALYRAPHWRVGWRFVDGAGLLERPDDPPRNWRVLPDDGLRFYADPFPFVHDGELYLFVEDFEHRLGRGVISVVRFDEDGPTHVPTPVLHHRVHLSYPFVLEDAGDIWMIPETNEAGTIELYRAVRFPDEWTLVSTLVADTAASDATVFQHAGRWWMTATVRSGGSFSDALHLWHADQLTGPWHPHRGNPVLIDIASARPAGRVESHGGRLLRPVQDGRSGYGTALAVAEITALDDDHFEQRVLARLAPGDWWPGRRLHTLNRAGRLETIDGSAMAPRYWRRRRTEGPTR